MYAYFAGASQALSAIIALHGQCFSCDKRRMLKENEKFDENAAVEWLRKALADSETSYKTLGEAWGFDGDDPGNYVAKTLAGTRKMKLHEFLISREFFGQPIQEYLVPLMGRVGAGGHIYGMSDEPIDYLEDVKGKKPGTLAVEVDGTSMGALIPDGSILLYDTIYDAPLQEHINRICIVWRADGKTMVKKLLRGSRSDRWSLLSLSDGHIEDDVFIDHIARVTGVEFR